MIHLRDSGGASIIGKLHGRDAGGLFTIKNARVRDGSGLSLVYTSARYGISPPSLFAYGASDSTIYVSTGSATVGGDIAGKTILWTVGNPAIIIVNPSASSTIFRAHLASGDTEEGFATASVNGTPVGSVFVSLTNGGIS